MRQRFVLVVVATFAITIVLNTDGDRDVARGAGTASVALTGVPPNPVAVGSNFELSVELTSFTPTVRQDAWATISADLDFDATVIALRDSRPGDLADCSAHLLSNARPNLAGGYFVVAYRIRPKRACLP